MAVERSGQVGSHSGLKRENSGEPSMAKRRTSFSIDEEEHPKTTAERKPSIASELDARKNSAVVEETIPEVEVETPSIEVNKQLGGDPKATKGAKGGIDLKKAASNNAASKSQMNGSSSEVATTAKTVDKPAASKATARPAPISTAKTSSAPKPSPKAVKSPAPKTPTTPRGRPESAKQIEKSEKKENKALAKPTNTAKPEGRPATGATQGASAKTRIPPSPPQTGFVKPKPRSPTRPIKLPASLTAHTASSGSKTATAPTQPTASRRSLSRASGNSQAINTLQAHQPLSRSPSRARTATAPKSLARKPSTLNKAHRQPSLGPPPSKLKKQTSRQSLPQTAPADEGFLARMMRPTTSSASKTADKAITPPKKAPSVKRPVTRDGPTKHDAPQAAAPKMGKLVTKPSINDPSSAASSSVPAKAKEEPKPVATEEPKSETLVAQSSESHTQVAGLGESASNAAEDKTPPVGDSNATATDADLSIIEEATSAEESPVIDKAPEVESTAEELAPIEDPVAPAQEPAKKDDQPAAVEQPVVPEPKEMVPERSEEAEAANEAVETSKTEAPIPEKTVEVEIPKDVEVMEDPEDVKAREEIAKLNAEVSKASADDDVE